MPTSKLPGPSEEQEDAALDNLTAQWREDLPCMPPRLRWLTFVFMVTAAPVICGFHRDKWRRWARMTRAWCHMALGVRV